ncbi:hypothetical protein BJY00DRAFT_308116 [Aspergillus carlsbadensis]|nr:hypothetical protein BJY00DRAFT_308116 [Aspergillus carlsbadensis]
MEEVGTQEPWQRGGRLRMVQEVRITPATPTPKATATAKGKAKAKSPQKKRVAVARKTRVGEKRVVKAKARQRQAATAERGRQRQRGGSGKRGNAPVAPRRRISKGIQAAGTAAAASVDSPSSAATPQDEPQQARSASEPGASPTTSQLRQRINNLKKELQRIKVRAAIGHWVDNDRWPKETAKLWKNGLHLSQSEVVQTGEEEDGEGEGEAPPEQDGTTSATALTENTQNFPHRSPDFEPFLRARNIVLDNHRDGIVAEDITAYRSLLEHDCKPPKGKVFDDSKTFHYLCDRLRYLSRREIIVLVSALLVPPATIPRIELSVHSIPLMSSRDTAWVCSLALDAEEGDRQGEDEGYDSSLFRARIACPHYSVGFHATAFTQAQRDKLQPFLGGILDTSYFKGVMNQLFPFFTAEAKDSDRLIEEAEAQNAYAMALALRGVVKLFRLANREQDIHRRVLGYSIAFNHSSVRIHAHYPVFAETAKEGSQAEVSYYRQTLRKFDYTDPSRNERWTSYKFVIGLYSEWVPEHHKRLCAVIDALPEPTGHEFSLGSTPLEFKG